MSQHEYMTPLFMHEDGTFAVHGGDIRGLVVEADTLDELRSELRRIAPRLLRSNHGLTEDEIAQASLRLVLRPAEDAEGVATFSPESLASQAPRLFWEDNPRITTMAGA